MLFKEIVDARKTDIEGSQKLTEHFVLRWAKNKFHLHCHLHTVEVLVPNSCTSYTNLLALLQYNYYMYLLVVLLVTTTTFNRNT